ncbi:hypothetical protein [Chroococcidiopsis sp.]|uniref:hypothetical protein n=1 Tax=Chroococcidiopsis sp. TaxID=3088168 RepID=UPI003F66853C
MSIKRQHAIDAVDRIMLYGRTEKGDPLDDTKWFRQQIRLTADNRIAYVITTGASQVSKSLVNYLDAIDTLITGQLDIGWFYASRTSMNNQQPSQFQRMVHHWVKAAKVTLEIDRDAVSRFMIGNAIANFSYANSDSTEKSGGASEGKEQASFQASKLYLEEKSSHKATVDVTPRLGASRLLSKPIRELGTPGAGVGIERSMLEAKHVFCPAVHCRKCKQVTWLEPKGALLKPIVDSKTNAPKYFNARGEIIDYHAREPGRPESAFIACVHCGYPVTNHEIINCDLRSKVTLESVDEYLDSIPDDIVQIEPVAIYLSPLLRIPSDPMRVWQLIRDGLNPVNPSIYQQNKLGYASVSDNSGVSPYDFERVISLDPWVFSGTSKPQRFLGIDQGRDTHYAVILECDGDAANIIHADTVAQYEINDLIKRFEVTKGFMDNEPDRLSAYEIVQANDGILALADQRTIDVSYKEITVKHGAIEIPAYAINSNTFKDLVIANFVENNYRIACELHRKFQKHITSVKRNSDTGKLERPADHDDDFFFAMMFAHAAESLYKGTHKPIGKSSVVGQKLALPGQKAQFKQQTFFSKRTRF